MKAITRKQREGIFNLFLRDNPSAAHDFSAWQRAYRRFRRRFRYYYGGYVGIENWHGMFVGIEPDGYTHT